MNSDIEEHLQKLEQTRIELNRVLKNMTGREPNYPQLWDERASVINAIFELKRNIANQKSPRELKI